MRSLPASRLLAGPVVVLLPVVILLAACSANTADMTDIEPLPALSVDEFRVLLGASPRPIVVNIWASWCAPCRSEAPLLRAAHQKVSDEIRFVGVDVEDTQSGARAFLAEFAITYENYFDPDGAIPAYLGGFGVPQTYFFAPGGELVYLQQGVIDEQTLALQIDELMARS